MTQILGSILANEVQLGDFAGTAKLLFANTDNNAISIEG
jgi:fumarylacetoacetate (FAA) hydrolase family protein